MTRRLGIAPVFVLLGLAALSSACSTLVVPVKEPTPSALAFADAAETPAFDLVVSDARSPQERADIAGGFYVPDYRFREAALDPVAYLAEGVERELASRGLHETSGATSVKLAIRSFHFENHRVSPFAPWVALTTVSADVETARRTQRIASFVKRAKLAVWTMDEINDPCFSDALSIATKELAAKVNRALWGRRLSDVDIDALIARVEQTGERDTTWLDVYQLGFGNNPRAIPVLAKLVAHTNEYVRMAAISGLGTLHAVEEFDRLKQIATSGGMWQDRAIALKAIGDLATPEAKAFLDAEWERLGADLEGRWSRSVIALYK